MSTISDLFNPVGVVQATTVNKDLYRPNFKEGKSGIYTAVIRFVPYFADATKCVRCKRTAYVKNPITQKGMYVDDPKAWGEPSVVTDMFFKLKNTGVDQYVNLAKTHLSSKDSYATLVQILKDEQHPELEGQIKVLIFGKTLYDKIIAEQTPTIGQGSNPFHPYYGRHFALIYKAKGDFNDPSNSYFFDEKNAQQQVLPSGLWIPDANGQMIVAREGMEAQVSEYLEANSPDLSKYDATPWTPEQTKHVQEVLAIVQNYVSTGVLSNVTSAPSVGVTPSAPVQPAVNAIPVQPSPVFPGAVQQPVSPVTPVTPSQPVAPATPSFSNNITGDVAFGVPAGQPAVGPTIVGATLPNVAPAAAPSPSVGVNMDDILNSL